MNNRYEIPERRKSKKRLIIIIPVILLVLITLTALIIILLNNYFKSREIQDQLPTTVPPQQPTICVSTNLVDISEKTESSIVKCPEKNDVANVLLPNPDNCSTFFQCVDGELQLLSCPIDLHFNAKLKTCDCKWAAGCQSFITNETTTFIPKFTTSTQAITSTIEPTTLSTEPSTEPTTPSTEPITPSTKPTTPSTKPTTLSTEPEPTTPFTKPTTPSTEPTTPSTEPTTPSTKPTTPSTKPTTVLPSDGCKNVAPDPFGKYPVYCPPQEGPEDNFFFSNPKDCQSFYHCTYGIPYLCKCPGNLFFNPKKEVCDWPRNVKCHVEN
ncbi:mucin-2-like [Phymastichus coffea]|uniref:mucin-2-like n=1 Tax=Phymastichus coffea TaxID=108790 RepID=UPI00273BCF7E|nr:mucin-2-like [Phymastichus coffea]